MNIEEAASLVFTITGNGRYKRTIEHDSLVLDTATNTFFWNSVGFGGDVYTFLTKIVNVEASSARLLSTPSLQLKKDSEEINKFIHLLFWEYGKNHREFWYKRGFNDLVIDMYKLGYFGGSYSIPFVMRGELQAVALRRPDKQISEIAGSKKSLFGFDELISKEIFIVESPLDVPLLRMIGYDAISFNYGANSWDTSWNSLLFDYNVYIIPDNDSAGKHLLKKITFPAKVIIWPKETPKGFDTGKLYLNNREKFINNIEFLKKNSIPIELCQDVNV